MAYRLKIARLRLEILRCRLGIIVNIAIVSVCSLVLEIIDRKERGHV